MAPAESTTDANAPQLLTKQEVAHRLAISPRQLDRLIDDRRLPLTRIRLGYRIVRFAESEVAAVLGAELETGTAA